MFTYINGIVCPAAISLAHPKLNSFVLIRLLNDVIPVTQPQDELNSRPYNKLKSHNIRTHFFHQFQYEAHSKLTLRPYSSFFFVFFLFIIFDVVCVFAIANGRWLINCHNESPHNQVFVFHFIHLFLDFGFGFSGRYVHRRLNFYVCPKHEMPNWIWIN